MRTASWLLAGAFCMCSTTSPAQPDTLTYTLAVRRAASGAQRLDVEFAFRTAAPITRLIGPSTWAGQDSLWLALDSLRVDAPLQLERETPSRWTVAAPARSPVTLRYTVHQDWTGNLDRPRYLRPVLDSTRVIFNGQNGLLVPDLPELRRVVVRVRWMGLPGRWAAVSSIGSSTDDVAELTVRELRNAAFVAGRFRVLHLVDSAATLAIAVQGDWHFSDSTFARLVAGLWRVERRLWGEDPYRNLFVALVPIVSQGNLVGTAFTAGVLALADTGSQLEPLGQLVAHELNHEWNGQRAVAALPEERYKWLSEGFTEYYADRAALAAGLLTDSGYVESVSAALARYATSGARGAALPLVEERYWSNPEFNRYPYWQGYALALTLDAEFRRGAPSRYTVDSLARGMYRAAVRDSAMLSDSLLVAVAPAALRPFVRSLVDSAIVRGAMLLVPLDALGACATGKHVRIHAFDLGFDADVSTRARVVSGVVPAGPAARAGLRDSMPIAGWGWYNGDATRAAEVRVREAGRARIIRYLPASTEAFEAVEMKWSRAACRLTPS